MKKLACFLLLLCLLLAACGEKEYVFPEGATIGGVSVGGMNAALAEQTLHNAAASYRLQVELDGVTTTLNAEKLGLRYVGGTPTEEMIGAGVRTAFAVDPPSALLPLISGQRLDVLPTAEPIYYSEAEEAFLPGAQTPGVHYDYSEVEGKILTAAKSMLPQVTVEPSVQVLELPEEMQEELERANAYGDLKLTYRFACPLWYEAESYTLDRGEIMGLLEIQPDGMTVLPNREAVAAFAEALAEEYGESGQPGEQFLTAAGGSIILRYSSGDCWVDADALTEDLYTCLTEGISGTREAEYLSEGNGWYRTEDFGGTYVEVDIQNQMVYCFEDGVLRVQSPCVTGCVANGDETPTGIYHFYNMDRDTWLVGPTWEDWVDCWMAFYGGYGMHDANWRTEFGGDIYLENGSHGCVNLPPEVAPQIYAIIDIGDAIIIY